MDKLLNLSTETLRQTNPEIVRGYIICIKDEVSLENWAEDVADAPGDYPYSSEELEQFLTLVR